MIQRRLADLGELVYRERDFKPGDRVMVGAGPFKDFEAVFEESLSSRDRARILVDSLCRWTPCEVEMECLEKVHYMRPGRRAKLNTSPRRLGTSVAGRSLPDG